MNCLLKNIPPENLSTPYDGNRGIGFPLQSPCEVLVQPDAPPPPPIVIEECYLAIEEDGFISILTEELSSIEIPCP